MDGHQIIIREPGTAVVRYARKVAEKFFGDVRDKARLKKDGARARAQTYIYRVCGLKNPAIGVPPFRAPHHTVSREAMVGKMVDGFIWRPGEYSLAHGGTLLMDDLPEFSLQVIETLSQPLANGCVSYRGFPSHPLHYEVPARFRLIATTMPCPCGWHGTMREHKECSCSDDRVERYQARIPKWLRDRCETIRFTDKLLE